MGEQIVREAGWLWPDWRQIQRDPFAGILPSALPNGRPKRLCEKPGRRRVQSRLSDIQGRLRRVVARNLQYSFRPAAGRPQRYARSGFGSSSYNSSSYNSGSYTSGSYNRSAESFRGNTNRNYGRSVRAGRASGENFRRSGFARSSGAFRNSGFGRSSGKHSHSGGSHFGGGHAPKGFGGGKSFRPWPFRWRGPFWRSRALGWGKASSLKLMAIPIGAPLNSF